MKITRLVGAVGGTLLLVAAGASVALVGGSGTASAAGQPSSAFGLHLTGAGTPVIDQTPTVVSSDGKQVEDSLGAIPENPLITGGIVNVSARNNHASASVTELNVLNGIEPLQEVFTQLEPLCSALDQIPLGTITEPLIDPVTGTLLPALTEALADAGQPNIDLSLIPALDFSELLPDQLGDLCDVGTSVVQADTVTAECNGDSGTAVVAGLTVAGLEPTIDTNQPNRSIEVPGLLELTVNRQTKNADGTFTVDALYLNLLDQIELTVSSATCGEVLAAAPPSDPTESDAPTPRDPVTTNAPVTG